jgi:hypothetical protein
LCAAVALKDVDQASRPTVFTRMNNFRQATASRTNIARRRCGTAFGDFLKTEKHRSLHNE